MVDKPTVYTYKDTVSEKGFVSPAFFFKIFPMDVSKDRRRCLLACGFRMQICQRRQLLLVKL
jgi:hypothetical protein